MGVRTTHGWKGYQMSLAVPADLLEKAHRDEVDDTAFLDCIRTSLPYAWDLITGLITERGVCEANEVAMSGLFPERSGR